jgi:hypothetical protein
MADSIAHHSNKSSSQTNFKLRNIPHNTRIQSDSIYAMTWKMHNNMVHLMGSPGKFEDTKLIIKSHQSKRTDNTTANRKRQKDKQVDKKHTKK